MRLLLVFALLSFMGCAHVSSAVTPHVAVARRVAIPPPRAASSAVANDDDDEFSAVPRLLHAINTARVTHSAGPLRVDRGLCLVAERAASEYQRLGRGAEQRVVEGANRELRGLALLFPRVSSVAISVDHLHEAGTALGLLQAALDPRMVYVGLVVARAGRTPFGAGHGFDVVVTLGE